MYKILTSVLELYDLTYEQTKTRLREADFSEISPITILVLGLSALILSIKKILADINKDSEEQIISNVSFEESEGSSAIATAVLHKDAKITSGFGANRSWNRTPSQRREGNTTHKGIDLQANMGDYVYAPFDGVVLVAKESNSGAGGRTVTIQSNNGKDIIMLCHLSKLNVKRNQKVSKGEILGRVGGSGHDSDLYYKPHLHLQTGVFTGKAVVWRNPVKSTSAKIPIKGRTNVSDDLIVRIVSYFMMNLSLTPPQACGLVANLYAESNLNPTAHNPKGGGRGAMGIAGWRGNRISNYERLFGKTQLADANLSHQLEYVVYEFKNVAAYQRAWNKLKYANTAGLSSDIVLGYYEFQAGLSIASSLIGTRTVHKRREYANRFLSLYYKKYGYKNSQVTAHQEGSSSNRVINNYNSTVWH